MQGDAQQRVWAEVERYSALAAAQSPTRSYQAIYDKPEVKRHQEDITRALGSTAPTSTSGAAVFANGALVGLDLFQEAGLFTRQWPKLLRAYALEAYDPSAPSTNEETLQRRRVERLLHGAGATEGAVRASAGMGWLIEFHLERFRGAALLAEGLMVHATLL